MISRYTFNLWAKKRIALAGVLVMEPEVLIMDEPTAGLDFQGITRLKTIMEGLNNKGTTLIVATHDIDWVCEWADLVYVLAEGKLVASGAVEIILKHNQFSGVVFSKPVIGEIFDRLIGSKISLLLDDIKVPRTTEELLRQLEIIKTKI